MSEFNLGRVRAAVADQNPMVRQGVRNALYSMGFREILDTAQLATAHELCQDSRVDLLVINSELGNTESSYLTREMRRTRLGEDPFVVVISLLPIADAEHVRKVVDSGADDLLLIPFAPEQLRTRLQTLIARRKPFVVTHDYIGPDRRKTPRPGAGQPARQLLAPNPIAARASGVPAPRYQQLVQQASEEIRNHRIGSLARYVRREGCELFATGRDGQPLPTDLVPRLFRLEQVVDEVVSLSGTTLDLAEFSRLCAGIRTAGGATEFAEIERLYGQTEAISARYGCN